VSENSKYCSTCGSLLWADRFCEKCDKQRSDYFDRELADRNKQPWAQDEWFRKYMPGGNYQNTPLSLYVCHVCRYFMHHHLQYCPTCGGRFDFIKMVGAEIAEKMADYKQGF
jgi:RNA polymerase subunit RPABC4/transcription elongation factor Spt4